MLVRVTTRTGALEDSIKLDTKLGVYLILVKAQPIDGKANEAVIKVLSDYFEVPKTLIRLRSGHTSRHKTFEISV